jgi:ABC-type branched-subunit amino acid transport system substrate-binding protein
MTTLKKLVLFAVFIWPPLLLADNLQVTLHYIGPTEGQAWDGVEQGLDEANLQGRFLGQEYKIETVSEAELAKLKAEEVTAILVASDADHVMSIARMPQFATVPVLNLTSDADKLRQACLPNLLNIPPSNRMKQDALAQWQAKNADVPVTARTWHEDFVKFAASQLNNRFTKKHDRKMGDDAWAGWAAVKMLSDSVARTQSTDSAAMLKFLRNDLSFDGQKGDTATFRDTGQLRQIILLVDEQNKIVAEAPLRGVKGGLDSLGQLSCQ